MKENNFNKVIFNFKSLPKTHKATASALCTSFFLLVFLGISFVLRRFGTKIPTSGYLIGILSAQVLGTLMFNWWVRKIYNLKEEK